MSVQTAVGSEVVALAHDYLSQRGGAERVVLALARAFPEAPIYTSFYESRSTFPEFADVDIRTLALDRIGPLRRRHRLALPLLAPAFSRLAIDAPVVVCSSSGWAHGVQVTGRKVVYCHAPARWLYQGSRYLSESGPVARTAVKALRGALTRWDRSAARTADRYLANSTFVADQIRRIYGLDAEILHPPVAIDVTGPRRPLPLVDGGCVLCVSRLLPYKNLDHVIRAFDQLPREHLVIVGDGPDEERLRSLAGRNVTFVGALPDPELRWLYAHARALVAASYEDFGLTPLEAAAFGKPSAALRFGGFRDTIVEDATGVYFDAPEPNLIAASLRTVLEREWDADALTRHVDSFSEARFAARIRDVVAEELDAAGA